MSRASSTWRGLSTRGKAGVAVIGLVAVVAAIGSSGSPTGSASGQATPTPPLALAARSVAPQGLVISSPMAGQTVVADMILVSGLAPAYADVVQDVSFGPDQHVVADGSGAWSMTVSLTLGVNQLTFRIGDDTSTAVSLLVHYEPPAASTQPTVGPTFAPEPTATPVPPTVAPPTLAFNPIKLTGSGNKIARFTIPEDEPAIAVISEKGTSNFVVWSIDSTGSTNDLLVNVIGNYSGTRLFDVDFGTHSVAFKVEAHGSWTITIKPLSLATLWTATTSSIGKGDMVLRVDPPIDGFAASTFTYKGSSNFVVWAYGDEGRDLLVNEIGAYNGESLWPSGTVLIEIEAVGAWGITVPA